MRFHREKSRLLGLLALMAPLPLPFNEVVGWPPVIAFCGVAGLFLLRVERGEEGVLPYWAMNLLGLLYVPFLIGDLSALRSGRILPPLIHLALYAMAVKLFALRREKDKWHIFMGLFFLFVASMATSVHPAAIAYLIAFGSVAALTLIRFAGLSAVAGSSRATREPRVPVRRFLAGTILTSFVAAIPLFVFLPRLRQPYVYLPAGGPGGVVQVSGFSDRLDLGTIDRVRLSRTVVFRFVYETPPPPATEMRFKVTTYDVYQEGGWLREPRPTESLPRDRDGFFHLTPRFPTSWMKIWLRRGANQLVLPVEATAIDLARNGVVLDGAGEARFLLPTPGIVDYRVGMTPEPAVAGWRRGGSRPSELETSAVSPRMAELAEDLMGSGPPEERIRRLERYLRSEFRYSLDPVNGGPLPIEQFLFETREGHCEYFASAMVLLLRSQGFPARIVTGFLGSDYNPLEEYFIVRQSNAHAWVEAFVPGEPSSSPDSETAEGGAWTVFDPTPADARPQSGRTGFVTLMTQAYDYVLFRWDRYVLTYGFGDQVDVLIGFRDAWLRFWQALGSSADGDAPAEPAAQDNAREDDDEAAPKESGSSISAVWRLIPFLGLLLAALIWFLVRRERFSAAKAYRTLRARAAAAEAEPVPAWIGPLRLEERLLERHPEVAEEARCIVSHYVRESFAENELDASELESVRLALASATRKLRKSA